MADRGTGKKARSKVNLNISTTYSLRSSILFNLKSGLAYRGSIYAGQQSAGKNLMLNTSIITYQKGNTTYILPYKHRIAVPEISNGYAGFKLIFRK
jgi:hypothetical protein